MKCNLSDDKKTCKEVKRTCEEMATDKCGDYTFSSSTVKCELNNEKKICEEVKQKEESQESKDKKESHSFILKLSLSVFIILLFF